MNKDTSIIQVSGGLLQALHDGRLNLNAFNKNILVLECLVSGTSFCNLEEIEPELECGKSELKIIHEVKNKHDKFALRLTFNDRKAGYIPKGKNELSPG